MPEEKIEDICTYDRMTHNRNRAFAEQTVSLDAIMEKQGFNDEWGMNPLLEKNMEALSVEMEIDHNSTFWWVNELEDPALLEAVLSLTDQQRELITKIVYNGYSQTEVAKHWGVSQSTISSWWNDVCNIIAEYRFGKAGKKQKK